MPLQKLEFRPGVNRESTTLSNEGGWFESDKVRFRSGYPEKIGGWDKDGGTIYSPTAIGTFVSGGTSTPATPTTGSFWGVCRSLWNWLNLAGYNLLGLGTNSKYYVQNTAGGNFYDITPIRLTTGAGVVTFAATNGSTTITVTSAAHGAQAGDFVIFSGAASLGGNITAAVLNREYRIVTILSNNSYTITSSVAANASDTGTGGAATVGTYQINTGSEYFTVGVGWGAGGWGGATGSPVTTTLNGSINSTVTTITVVSTAGFAASGAIGIDGEYITYSGTTPTTFTGCTRGVGSTAASHSSGATVSQYTTATGWGIAAPAGLGVGIQLRLWSQSNFGENLIFNYRGGPLYFWAVNPNPAIFDRAQLIAAGGTITQKNYATGSGSTTVPSTGTIDATCPSQVNYVMVSDASRFTIAFGCNDPTGQYANISLDPMQIRWSDQESYVTWKPEITNQAGGYRLSHGSQIITAIQTRQEILVLTDAAIYSMQFVGAPYVWSFQIMGDNLSVMGPNAVVTVNNITYWMGTDKFYMYSGRVETLPCTLRQYIFDDINLEQSFQVVGSSNEGYNEIWWFYCSANSTTVDKYVIYNHLERTWVYGTIARTAWIDSPLRQWPMATTYATAVFTGSISGTTLTVNTVSSGPISPGLIISGSGIPSNTTITAYGTGSGGAGTYIISTSVTVSSMAIYGTTPSQQSCSSLVYHEKGNDDGTTNPSTAIYSYVRSSDFDIGDGHNFGMVWRIIPDVTFDGSTVNKPAVNFTVLPRQNPGANYGATNNPAVNSTQNYQSVRSYNVQQFDQYAYVRIRGRQMAFQISSSTLGVSWQLGSPRLDVRPDGRR